MSEIVENYEIIGSPTISVDHILTGTDSSNYLNFDDTGVFDATKSFDIIFKFRTTSMENQCAILQMGDPSDEINCITIYYGWGAIEASFGYNNLYMFDGPDFSQDTYYKISYDSSSNMGYMYYSTDKENWTLGNSREFYNPLPELSVANNKIGYVSQWGEDIGLVLNTAFLDLTALEIYSNGEEWYKAFKQKLDPIVTVTDVFSSNKTFKNKKKITSINCNNVKFVDDNMSFAFVNCSNLTSITNINQNITNMAYAFAGCPVELYNTGFPVIPNSVNDISGLFAYHTDWTDIPVQAFVNAWSKVPAHLQTNVAGFLDGCTNLSNVPANTLPNFMTNIAFAFRNCQAMTDMPIITENVVDMSEAFSGCTNMVNANYEIPNSVVNMSYAFAGCSNLTTTPSMSNATNVSNMDYTFDNCSNLTTTPTLPSSVEDLNGTFASCSNLTTTPVIPGSVVNMSGTFFNCTNITTPPAIPNSVINMENSFNGCYNLTSAPVIPNSVIDLSGTFRYCNKLVNPPTIGNSVVNMRATFSSCSNLINTPVIPNSVNDLGIAFYGCTNLTTAPIIPNSVTELDITFSGCSNLVNAPAIPNSVVNMESTFRSCPKITTAPVIPDSVIDMSYTFYNCYNLVNVPVIGNSVANMFGTFTCCFNLVNAPVIPNSVVDLGYSFLCCNKMVNAPEIPGSVINLSYTFNGCSNLVNTPDIPNSVTDLFYTFNGCFNLVSVGNIGTSVTNMYMTFNSCSNLTGNIYIYSNIITMANNCFNNTSLTKNVYIPFTYQNREYTPTYNSFITAGYDEFGTKNGVYLMDINPLPELEEGERYRMNIIVNSGEGV